MLYDTLERLMQIADRAALLGYFPDFTQRPGAMAGEARLDLEALQHAIALLKGEARERRPQSIRIPRYSDLIERYDERHTLSTRVKNVLMNNEGLQVGDQVRALRDDELLSLENFSCGSLREVRAAFGPHDAALRESIDLGLKTLPLGRTHALTHGSKPDPISVVSRTLSDTKILS